MSRSPPPSAGQYRHAQSPGLPVISNHTTRPSSSPACPHPSASASTIRRPRPPVSTPEPSLPPSSSGMRGSDELPRSAISTRAVCPASETITSNQPPAPLDAVCRTALEAISLTSSSTSSRLGQSRPSTPATNSRACPTAAASPGNQSAASTTGRSASTAGAVTVRAGHPHSVDRPARHRTADQQTAGTAELPATPPASLTPPGVTSTSFHGVQDCSGSLAIPFHADIPSWNIALSCCLLVLHW